MLLSVQYLRAFASFLVVMSHIAFKLEVNSDAILSGYNVGGYGVDLFFIISGFIMCLTVDKKNPNIITFFKDRIIRIIPLYWITTSAALIVYLYDPKLINSSGGETSVLSSYMLIPDGHKFLNNNGWTLSYEFYFYAIFSICLLFREYRKIICSLMLFTIPFIGLLIESDNPITKFLMSSFLLEFFMGILCYFIINKINIKPIYSVVIFSIGILILFYVNNSGIPDVIFGRALTMGITMSLIFVGFVSLEDKLPDIPFLYKAGDSSYSLYLTHPFVLSLSTLIMSALSILDNTVFYMLLMLGLSYIVSWYSYILLEKPIDRAIKHFKCRNY
ncbi:acyltransferase family protein [Vibrio splendidus]|uniref:acyltransferase family protein n=1 Tax=Vibrio splendidus TaxID=29497 RepID=UPI000D3CD0E6|nr:acyltransferase [Vibrio splendidus]PTO85997.1 acyltransferase [Vibrio splendidus]